MKKTAIILAFVLLLAACGPARGGEAVTLQSTESTAPATTPPGTTTDSEESKMTLAEAYRAVTQAGEVTDEVTYYKFGDMYYIFRVRERDRGNAFALAVKLYCFDGLTGTLLELNGGEELHMLQCRIQDSTNIFYLPAGKKMPGAQPFPEIVRLKLSPRRANGLFSCGEETGRATYFAPVSEDFYTPGGFLIGPRDEEYTRKLLRAADKNDGVSLLIDFFSLKSGVVYSEPYSASPSVNYNLEYDAENGTFSILIGGIDLGDVAEGAQAVQNPFIESAVLEKLGETSLKLTLKLTEYAKYYTVSESRVLAPGRPPAEWISPDEVFDGAGNLKRIFVGHIEEKQFFYTELKITFSPGEFDSMTGYVREEGEQEAGEYDRLVRAWYEGGIASWKSDWERMEYAEEPVNFIAEEADFFRWLTGLRTELR